MHVLFHSFPHTWRRRFLSRPAFLSLVLFVFAAFTLAACTEEKAMALYSAARGFQEAAENTFDAYDNLFQAAVRRPATTDERRIEDILKQVEARIEAEKPVKVSDLANRLDWERKSEESKAAISKEIDDMRVLYRELAASLEQLPQAHVLAREEAACPAEIVVRLIHGLTNYAENLKKYPVPMLGREEDYGNRIIQAVKDGNEAEKIQATLLLRDLMNERNQLTKEAIKQTLIAAEKGLRVVELGRQYNQVTLAEILDVVNQGLSIVNSVEGIDLDQAVKKAQAYKARIEGDKHWQRILALEFMKPGTDCNPVKEGT